MNSPKRIFKNFNSLFLGELVNRIAHIIAIIYIARIMGSENFGKISFALAILVYFLISTNLGLNEIGTREIAKDSDSVRSYTNSITSIRLLLAFISIIVMAVFIALINKSPDTKKVMLAYGLMLIPYALSVEWIFRGIEKMAYIGLSRMLSAVFYLVPVLMIIKRPDQLITVAYLTVLSEIVGSAFLYFVYRKKFGPVNLNFDLKSWKELLKLSLPLCASSVILMTYLNSGTILLGFFRSDSEVGIYSAAYRLVMIPYMVNCMFISAVFPTISRYYKESKEKLQTLFAHFNKLMVLAAVPIGIAVTLLSRQIIRLVYGQGFGESSIVLAVLIWFAVINFLSFLASYSLVACDRQKSYLSIMMMAGSANLVLNIILIPFMGIIGISIAMVASEALVLILSVKEINKVVKIEILKIIPKPLMASLAMAAFLILFKNWNLLLLAFLGTVIYFIFIALSAFLKEEVILVKSLIKN